MTTQFEFHLSGTSVPEGELEADQLLAIVTSLKEVATRIGRMETEAERLGRAPNRTRRVANLVIGLQPGSTRLMARRAGPGDGSLEFDLVEEQSFDEKFVQIVEAIADDVRPSWVDDSLSAAASDLTMALKQAAVEVAFKVDGRPRRTFRTGALHRDTWQAVVGHSPDELTFIGRLFAVNLKTHRLQVQDDVGNRVALPKVAEDGAAGRLLGSYVAVTGTPEYDSGGRLTQIHQACIVAMPDPFAGEWTPAPVPLDDILVSAPGLEPGGIPGLTDAEADAFFEAMGL